MRARDRVGSGAALLLGGLALLSGCTDSSSMPAPEPPTVDLRVMTFNIEYGGEEVDFGGVPKAVRAADADVVAVGEGYGNIPRLAAALGWAYYDVRSQVVSRLPLLTPPGSEALRLPPGARTTDGRAVLVEVQPGRVAAVINTHLPSTRYSPFAIDKGASADEILAVEGQIRVPELRRGVRTARELIADRIPVFLLGDFNAPSDLDWTIKTVGLREHIRFPVRWPTTELLDASGLVDSYRAVHPDPVADPGLTWPASRPFVEGYNPGPNGAAADRIDLLFSGGPARATQSDVVGEAGSPFSDIVVSPWPTDHRAVVSQFEVTPAPTPTLVSVSSRLISVGRSLSVAYADVNAGAEALQITAVDDDRRLIRRELTDLARGVELIDTDTLPAGAYTAGLLGTDGALLAEMPFWVEPHGARPHLQASRRSYSRGQPIDVSWRWAPGNRNDWIGIYRHGADPEVASYLGWGYIGSEIVGSATIGAHTTGLPWPLPSGRYTAYLLQDDGYDALARADFTVR